MIACVIHRAKDLEVENRPKPQPGEGEVIIRFGAGGICGSDLHYYHEGRVGNFELREPMVLGHELAGEVVQVGAGVSVVQPGQRVAVNPSRPCLRCGYCLSGQSNLCKNVRFHGSAARFPTCKEASQSCSALRPNNAWRSRTTFPIPLLRVRSRWRL